MADGGADARPLTWVAGSRAEHRCDPARDRKDPRHPVGGVGPRGVTLDFIREDEIVREVGSSLHEGLGDSHPVDLGKGRLGR